MEEPGAFIGRGWKFPPEFENNGQAVQTVEGAEEINQGIRILLKTRLGERIMHQDFGCNLDNYAFEDLSATMISEIKGVIETALLKYERRIEPEQISVDSRGIRSGVITISIDYFIPESNSRFNLVFPFYLAESNTI